MKEHQLARLRELADTTEAKHIAAELGLSTRTIHKYAWREGITLRRPLGTRFGQCRYSPDQRQIMLNMANGGKRHDDIAQRFGCSRTTIRRILDGFGQRYVLRKPSSSEQRRIVYLIQRHSVTAVALMLNLSPGRIFGWCRRNGIKRGVEVVTTHDETLIVAMHDGGMTIQVIADKFDAPIILIEAVIEMHQQAEAA